MKYKLVWHAALLANSPDADNDQLQVFYNAVSFTDLGELDAVAALVGQQLFEGFQTFLKMKGESDVAVADRPLPE